MRTNWKRVTGFLLALVMVFALTAGFAPAAAAQTHEGSHTHGAEDVTVINMTNGNTVDLSGSRLFGRTDILTGDENYRVLPFQNGGGLTDAFLPAEHTKNPYVGENNKNNAGGALAYYGDTSGVKLVQPYMAEQPEKTKEYWSYLLLPYELEAGEAFEWSADVKFDYTDSAAWFALCVGGETVDTSVSVDGEPVNFETLGSRLQMQFRMSGEKAGVSRHFPWTGSSGKDYKNYTSGKAPGCGAIPAIVAGETYRIKATGGYNANDEYVLNMWVGEYHVIQDWKLSSQSLSVDEMAGKLSIESARLSYEIVYDDTVKDPVDTSGYKEYTVSENFNFSGVKLHDNGVVYTGNVGGNASYTPGLTGIEVTTDVNSGILLPFEVEAGESFVYSVPITITSATDDERWLGLTFGGVLGANGSTGVSLDCTYHANMRLSGGNAGLTQVTTNWSTEAPRWANFITIPRNECPLEIGRTYVWKLIVTDGHLLDFYIDDVAILRDIDLTDWVDVYTRNELNGDAAGYLGIDGAGLTFTVNYSEPEGQYEQELYTSGSAIKNEAVVAWDSTSQLAGLSGSETPALVGLCIDSSLKVSAVDGTALEGTLADVAEAVYALNAVPMIYVDDRAEVEPLVDYLFDNALKDVMVASADIGALKFVMDNSTGPRGIYDLSASDKTYTEAEMEALRVAANSADVKILLLSETSADFETVKYLQAHLMTVWGRASDSDLSNYFLLTNGVDGIVTDDFAGVYSDMKTFTGTNVLLRVPTVSGHRGSTRDYADTDAYYNDGEYGIIQENTVEALIEAAKNGADAVEYDVFITADNVVVMHHNASTKNIMETANGAATNYDIRKTNYYGVLDQLVYIKDGSRMDTLEELFACWKQEAPDCVMYLEIKNQLDDDRARAIVTGIKRLVDEYEIADQTLVITFRENAMKEIRVQYAGTSLGCLMTTMPTDLETLLATSETYNATWNVSYAENANDANTLRHLYVRGIGLHGWTIDGTDLDDQLLANTYQSLTTDDTWKIPHWANHITVPAEVVAKSADRVVIDGAVINWLGEEIENAGLTPVTVSGNGLTANDDGTYTLVGGTTVVLLQYTAQTENGRTYTLYSNPVTVVDEVEPAVSFEGKTISILGDSISTFEGVSNNGEYNSTIAGGNVYYHGNDRGGVQRADTWWQQTIDQLGLTLLVNNSWSGSAISHTRSSAPAAYIARAVNLHNDHPDDPADPDIVAVFLGTNDFSDDIKNQNDYKRLGSTPDYDTLITENQDGTYTYATPTTVAEAYAVMIHKITVRYPNAELYCLSLLPRENQSDSQENYTLSYNEMFKSIAERFGGYFVDQYHDSGITEHSLNFDYYMFDSLHPAQTGMDAMTTTLVSALQTHSRYSPVKDQLYSVSYTLDERSIVIGGTDKTAVAGESFTVSFVEQASYVLDLTVTMGGVDVTDLYVDGSTLTIPEVTGDITITAVSEYDKDPANYLWAVSNGALSTAATGDGITANPVDLTAGSITDGEFSGANYSIETEVWLSHSRPWSVEWKSTGTWTGKGNGALLFSNTAASGGAGNMYIYRRTNADFIAMGCYEGGKYHNYGVMLGDKGIDFSAAHTYRLTNQVENGSNMVYLYVDGVLMGAMNEYVVGGTPQNTTSDWISGQDFLFHYMGTPGHPISGCSIEYIRVWENGAPDSAPAVRTVTFKLDNGVTCDGASVVTEGSAYSAKLTVAKGYTLADVTVTMGGQDITDTCCADGVITIDKVTGDIVITAKVGAKLPSNYHWELRSSGLISVASRGSTLNPVTLTAGSYSNSAFSKAEYALDETVILLHDRPWVIEWSSTWVGSSQSILPLSNAAVSKTVGNYYIFYSASASQKFLALGCYDGSYFHNYGVNLTDKDIDFSARHTYRLVNVVENGSNMVYLYVDGVSMGAMEAYFRNVTNQKSTDDWVSGKDFRFNHMGTEQHPLSNCSFDYIKVWENGVPAEEKPAEYRFELGANGLTASGGDYDGNGLTLLTGSYSGGSFHDAAYQLEEAIHLEHDFPWIVEWKSSGNWSGVQQGAMLFAEYNASDKIDAYYFYRRQADWQNNPNFFGFGNRVGSQWLNYGLTYNVDNNSHVFRLTNKVAEDGSNMVWLSVDGVEIGPLNGYNINGSDKGSTDTWVSGKDFHFSFFGAGRHLINSCSIDYIHVRECGHSWKDGVCTACGEVCEHSWEDGVCTVCGMECDHNWEDGTCTVCGKVCEHSWEDGTCTVCGKVCEHSWKDGVCTVCGEVCEHSWEDGACTVCGLECEHSVENGICTVCGKDHATLTVEGDQVTVTVPGLEEDTVLYVAFYTAEGQFLRCEIVDVTAGQEEFTFTLGEGETVAAYLLGENWMPLRPMMKP